MGCDFDQLNCFLPFYFCFYPSFKSKSLWNCEIKTVNLLHTDSYFKKYLLKTFLKAKKFLNVISVIKHTQKYIQCQNLRHKCNKKFVKSLDLQDQSFTHTETSQLVFNANKLTGFYVCETLVLNGLKSKVP